MADRKRREEEKEGRNEKRVEGMREGERRKERIEGRREREERRRKDEEG